MPVTPEAGPATPASALVFDHGGRRIGVALALPPVATATPLLTLPARAGQPDWPEVDRLIREWQPAALVVGVPYHVATGQASPGGPAAPGTSEAAALAFAAALAERYPRLPVTRIDERLSSAEATDRLREERRGGSRKHRLRAADVDAMAACVIAESWLKELPRTPLQ
jgi:putative Holliday junction resolvase